ncbi:MAG TPA: MFS transporter [Aldersonia sp.]
MTVVDDVAPAPDRSRRRSRMIIAVLSICGMTVALQQTLVVPLLPDFPAILNSSTTNVGWLVTITLLTGAVATPIVTRLADMFGKRRMMLVCLVAMVLGSVVAAVGGNFLAVVIGRGLQGIAIAQIPTGISIMRDELPRERVPAAVALMSATLGIGSAIGLPLSGFIFEHANWQAVFWTSAGAGVLLAIAVIATVPESSIRTRGRFDYVGAVMLSVALTALLLAITKGRGWGWTSEPTLGLFVLAVVVLGAWVPYERRVSRPLVDIRTSTTRPVLVTNIASLFVGFAMYANMLSTTQQLQMPEITGYGFGMSVFTAGLCMLPSGLAMVALAPVSAWTTKRFGAKVTLIAGSLVLAGGYVTRVYLTQQVWQIVVGAVVVSMGTAIAYAAMPTLIMRSVPITDTASANGVNTLLRAIGTSMSSAVVAAILASVTFSVGGVEFPTANAFQYIFWVAAFAALVAAGVTALLPPRSAAPVGGAIAEPETAARAIGEPRGTEIVVRGTVLDIDDQPLRHAVVTVLQLDGEPADWSRADNDGKYSVVLPGPGRYLVISSAEGWSPMSEIQEFDAHASRRHLRLRDPLRLAGRVAYGGEPLDGAMVSVTRPTGEVVGSVHTDADGRYAMTLPPGGHNIITVVTPDQQLTRSRKVLVIATQSNTVDIDLAEENMATVHYRPRTAAPRAKGG